MADIFENTIICKDCKMKMKPVSIEKNGFILRAVQCPKCQEKIIHPKDEEEYNRFLSLRGKTFKVKMRIVGNSYAVSIPKEIVGFIKQQERIMDDMVSLCFSKARRLSLMFGENDGSGEENIEEKEIEEEN